MTSFKYRPPLLMENGHVQTIFPVLFRRVDPGFYFRERIETDDKDFLDLDWALAGSDRLAILSHGLEGDSHRAYMAGMARTLKAGGWDALAWNYRSCSGEPNRLLRFYHNGATDDLARVITHAKNTGRYQKICLIGFSLGGNLTLVYLGRDRVDPLVKNAVAFSVPCDLKGSSMMLEKPGNRIYMKRFLVTLHRKIREKMVLMPGQVDDAGFSSIRTFRDFDNRYTAPIHGFQDAEDYWKQCSSLQFIRSIPVPTLIVNAMNDPFLSESCFPIREAGANPNVFLETPLSGGHVGFIEFNARNTYWSEKRALWFLSDTTGL
ncbi:MAG: alpha/beta fold hydrolase [Pseudomonadota bacterium]